MKVNNKNLALLQFFIAKGYFLCKKLKIESEKTRENNRKQEKMRAFKI